VTPAAFHRPWTLEEEEWWFCVRDHDGQQLAYVYFDDPRSTPKPLTKDEARADCGQYRQAAGAVGQATCAHACCHNGNGFICCLATL